MSMEMKRVCHRDGIVQMEHDDLSGIVGRVGRVRVVVRREGVWLAGVAGGFCHKKGWRVIVAAE